MTRELRTDERICQSCGRIFRYKKGRGRKPNYCKTCRNDGKANKSKCKKWYYNNGWIVKRDYSFEKNLKYKYNLTVNKNERKSQSKLPPKEYNQDDDYWGVGNTNISESPKKNANGDIKWDYELNTIRKEKRRLGL